MRHLAVLTVALLLVLAGCNGAPGGATTVEPTTAPEATDAASTGTEATSSSSDANPDEVERPPGLSADGVTDAEALATAHADALANRSYTYHRDVALTATDGSELGRWSQRVQVGADRSAFNFTQTGAGVGVAGTPVGDARTYTNGSVTFANASELPDGYYRSAGRGFAASRFDGQRLLADALSGAESDVTTVERDGETRFVVTVESDRETVAADRVTAGDGEASEIVATNRTATAFVSPAGLVENVTYEYDFERGNVTGHRTETVRYAAVGETSVERPAWVADAREAVATRLAPGLGEDGVTDAEALADAHAEVLRHSSYAVVSNLTARDEGVVRARQNVTTRVVHDPTRSLQRSNVSGEDPASMGLYPSNVAVWTDQNGTWYAVDDENGTTYRRASDGLEPASADRTARDQLYVLFGATDETTVERTVENGTTRYRVTATGGDDDLLAGALHADAVANVTATMLVRETGLVSRYRVSYDATIGNATAHVDRTVRFTALGETSVERPPWYDEAVNETGG